MLIDCSYFTEGPRHILNAGQTSAMGRVPSADGQAVNEAIKGYIKTYQSVFLQGVLGMPVACTVTEYLKHIEGNEDAEHDTGMDRLIERLREPFANYVFFKILGDANTQASMKGLVMLKSANTYVAPIKRQVKAWNEMVDMLKPFDGWCRYGGCTIPGITISKNFLTKINSLNL